MMFSRRRTQASAGSRRTTDRHDKSDKQKGPPPRHFLLIVLAGCLLQLVLLFLLKKPLSSMLGFSTKASNNAKLRFDWTNMPVLSDMAMRMLVHQTNCSFPSGTPRPLLTTGLGSSLHGWCRNIHADTMRRNVRTHSRWSPAWVFRDQERCSSSDKSPLQCYFPVAEHFCPNDNVDTNITTRRFLGKESIHYNRGKKRVDPETLKHTSESRAACTEYLFRSVSQLVIDEAERQLKLVFPGGVVPPNLITVHIRWGDKIDEMPPPPISEYLDGVYEILNMTREQNREQVNIFLATEDRNAVKLFREAVPTEWNVYLDQYFVDTRPYRKDGDERVFNVNNDSAEKTKGRAGLVALGSLLLAMEANDFVLTTRSNWSQLMNELRKNVVDPRCNGCTHMVDLRYWDD